MKAYTSRVAQSAWVMVNMQSQMDIVIAACPLNVAFFAKISKLYFVYPNKAEPINHKFIDNVMLLRKSSSSSPPFLHLLLICK